MIEKAKPFTEEQRNEAVLACRFCPMCHDVDVVTSVTRWETYSPRGRAVTLFGIEKGKLKWDADVADVMYKFTADGLSRHICAGHIDHDELVIDARRRLVEAGMAPPIVAQLRANVEKTGNVWAEKEPDLEELVGSKPSAGAGILLYFGPSARVRRPGSIKAVATLFRKAGIGFTYLKEEGDPGLALYQLGEKKAGLKAAGELADKILKARVKRVVTFGADAFRVLKVGFGDFPGLPDDVSVDHASTVLDVAVRERKLSFNRPGKRVAYHDPCALARFAPCLESPRYLIREITGEAPLELPDRRDRAECSGECGGLPFTNPKLAKAAALRKLDRALDTGAEVLVTPAPAGAVHLAEAAGDMIEVKDLAEFAAAYLKE